MAIARAIKSINAGFLSNVNGFEVEKKEFDCFSTQNLLKEQQRLSRKENLILILNPLKN